MNFLWLLIVSRTSDVSSMRVLPGRCLIGRTPTRLRRMSLPSPPSAVRLESGDPGSGLLPSVAGRVVRCYCSAVPPVPASQTNIKPSVILSFRTLLWLPLESFLGFLVVLSGRDQIKTSIYCLVRPENLCLLF